jgi:TolB-like protein
MANEREAASQDTSPAPGEGAAVLVPAVAPSLPSRGSSWLRDRVKRHKVIEWTLAYAAFAFASLHLASLLTEALERPHVLLHTVTLILLIGLPIVPILAWYHGVRALKRVSGSELLIISLLLAICGGLLWLYPHRPTERTESSTPVGQTNTAIAKPDSVAAVFNPPAHFIAVLPFLNMSGDPKQEYFSDGITEELLNALSRLNDLQVMARTSSFSFKGKDDDVSAIAHKLNVAAILEGSVRRAGNTVRITVQLINAVNGFHMWSQTYDRNLTDILKVQSDVATSVAQQLEVKLVGDEANKVGLGGTTNPEAYDSYLRGEQLTSREEAAADRPAELAAFDRAIALDPNYAAAYSRRASALSNIMLATTNLDTRGQLQQQALAAAQRAVALAPEFGESHLALGAALRNSLDFVRASPEYERALALAPGSSRVQRGYAQHPAEMGHSTRRWTRHAAL